MVYDMGYYYRFHHHYYYGFPNFYHHLSQQIKFHIAKPGDKITLSGFYIPSNNF